MSENQNISIDHPKTLGQELRRLREAAGVTLDAIVDETKVSKQIFESLEAGKFQHLPERVFCKNFLRQYAAIVGGDLTALTDGFDRAWDHFQEVSGSIVTLTVEEPPTPHVRWWVWLPFLLVAIVVVILIVVSIRGSAGSDVLPPDPRRSAIDRSTPDRVISTPTAIAEADVDTQRSETEDDGLVVTAVLRVARGKECWVHYRDRDGQVGEALLDGGGSTTLELPGPVLLTIGNADAATIEVGATEFTNLGRPGEVVRFLLGENGLEPAERDPRDD